ncbi:ATP-dependent helicase HrpB [Streptomyces stelliscabiei]|uniref:ATP-dependent helicase HrpB n=3 Tax=Streptomyces stelliscabiei TaxID=146820 RepID=A0A8I0P5C2_9ACTN|nr:ATP-dependent helicase HrpB [Streptomyces stelliscabiei]KND41412.1 ATP-dependent helicase [Streptomyces stelliscabiei]MBE1596310.1 ATP-dependent helicase HrpB [Streptomyces stelliscabiei]MDX2518122.1 ATP-dependent helicase HrpB [Streptomyces stelliscabiei]MDX2555742.1 ATP-dependent helicase HrpB [Streptomyces stelliscabiei]MDX2614271.1 ATP-dependent helicase HrpB [Streptomyces stelliscabiei]
MIRYDALDALPVRTALPALDDALEGHGAAVLVAPPGTGKTTLVPLALAGLLDGGPARRVVVAEPRRIAARAAARRMAWLLGEKVGASVGYTVRGERVVGPHARVEVVTTGVLLQRLQRDQELPGVDVVVLDECHERHLDADTAAAFLLDVREALRPGLRLVAASATTDAQGWARLLGGAPVVAAQGVSYPVEVVWAPPPRPVRPPHGMRVDPAALTHVASVVRRALAERAGDVLCFLPGVGEIARVAGQLAGLGDVEVLQVHGRAPAAVQDAVLTGGEGRRVVLATSVAESSLTVPGVRVVVDSGLAREPRVDHARGIGTLTTVRASRAAGRQRAGRAGREAPGAVYRCWAEAEDGRLPGFPSPEIKVADLTAFALQAACWGDPDASGLALLDPPPSGAMAAARDVLSAIGAVSPTGHATDRGARMARLGLHPRLARALLDATPLVGAERAAEVVALLSEEPPREYGDDLTAALRTARRGGDAYAARWRTEVRRLRTSSKPASKQASKQASATWDAGAGEERGVGVVAALAFPERVAREDRGGYLMVSGTRAEVGEGSGLRGAPWIAVAVADRATGAGHARVRLGAAVDEQIAREAAGSLYGRGEEVAWRGGDVVARTVERLGAVELVVRPLREAAPGLVREALLEGLRAEGFGLLRWSQDGTRLRERLAFLHGRLGAPWPDVCDDALHARVEEWLEPELGRARRRADLGRIDAGEALKRLLPWATGDAVRLEELAPERIEVPSGSRIRVDYARPEQPVLAVKLQEMFGLRESPVLAGVPVLVHLLSPAGRPAAVTADLASFWKDGYRAVRAELRGRYPRHPWPEDPATAEPTRYTNARLRR